MKFAAARKAIRVTVKAVFWLFIVIFVYVGSLCFREQRLRGEWIEKLFDRFAPPNLVLKVESASFGFRHGLRICGVRLSDASMNDSMRLIAGADVIAIRPVLRRVRIEGARYTRLPDAYYAPGNLEKNARVEGEFPEFGTIHLELVDSDILGIRPRKVTAKVEVLSHRVDFRDIHLTWPDADRPNMTVDGWCFVDLDEQVVHGRIEGLARQAHIRPLLVAIDIPVALPYMDGFTEVPEPCPASCEWKVDLTRNDLDIWLGLHPTLGRYNAVPMKRADGRIHVNAYTRGTCMNYLTTVGPIDATDVRGRTLHGTVVVTGTNHYNVVDVDAKSTQPLADVLKIAGFTGDYVTDDVFGESTCKLQFRFPRAMTNNYEVLNGHGSVRVRNGQLMRMKGFKGLLEAMPSMAPAVTWISDSTQASCDYVIENGVLRTDNIFIEGTLFSLMMYGTFDTVKEKLDFTVRLQFTQKDSMLGKIVHPLSWPFTKLLLEFRLTGTPDNPKWSYVSVLDRVLESVK